MVCADAVVAFAGLSQDAIVRNDVNRRIVLASRPDGAPRLDNFRLEEVPLPVPGPGQVLVRTRFLGVEPAMRGWIAAARSYSEPVPIGGVMRAFGVGEVAASNDPGYQPGETVTGLFGWQEWAAVDPPAILRKVVDVDLPMSTALGIMGVNGMTAYVGLLDIGQPRPGETVVVSTAAGAVGSAVGQIAKIKGCRTVAIAGGPAKCHLCLSEFGYDAAIDYKATPDIAKALSETCPKGIDVYFDNVGGPILDAVLEQLAVGARIAICGTIAATIGESQLAPRPNRQLLVARAKMEGFLVLDHFGRFPTGLAEIGQWLREGRIKYREDILDGIERAPQGLMRVLAGQNMGKQLIRVG
jgi:NADPH-dependent curcumin reductase